MAKCGRCGQAGSNVTVQTIRECYNGTSKAHGEPEPAIINNPMPPSEPQIKYVLGLQGERDLPGDYKVKTDTDLRAMDKVEVSGLIGMLKLLRRQDSAKAQPSWSMPSGRYAVKVPRGGPQENDHEWRFFLVDKPTDGKWKGYTFIKRLIGGGDNGDYRKVDMPAASRNNTLNDIEADWQQAMIDFGKQSGSCGHCGRALSNEDSLARGIGPICAGKMGW